MEEFLKQLMKELEKRLSYEKEDYTVTQHTVCKTNDTILHSVVIRLGNENISKNIYVEPYFYMNMRGTEMDEIVESIIAESSKRDDMKDITENLKEILDFNKIKDRIIVRVMSKEMNKEYLKDKVYIDVAGTDLVAAFYIFISKSENHISSICVGKEFLKHWDIDSGSDIYNMALENTTRLLPASICSMDTFISDFDLDTVSDETLEEVGKAMHILTNDTSADGAVAMLYDGVLKDFAITHDTDKVIIMPSSRHEVILLPNYKELQCQSSYKLVKEVNQYVVRDVDILSNNVYIYDLSTDSINIWMEG